MLPASSVAAMAASSWYDQRFQEDEDKSVQLTVFITSEATLKENLGKAVAARGRIPSLG